MTPIVSVIIPVYNVEPYLKDCLDSVANQTLKDIEIICINDGSTDNSLEILNEYAKKDSRFIVLTQENQGQGVARNKGVELAKGKYIQFVDPDDWVELDMLETLYNFAEEHNSQVVKFNYKEYNDYSGKYKNINFADKIKKEYNYDLSKNPGYNWRTLKKGCLYNLDLHVWAYFYLASFIKSNDIKCSPSRLAEDNLFSDGAVLLADKVDYLDKYLYFYKIRNSSSVRLKSDTNFCIFDNIERLKEFLIKHNLFEELQDEWADYSKTIVTWFYNHIPENSIEKYEQLCRKYYSDEKEFQNFLKKINTKRSFAEQIFSIKNRYKGSIKYKVITILGIPIYIKFKKKEKING